MALQLGFEPFWAHFNRAQVRRKLDRPEAALEDLHAAEAVAVTDEHRQAVAASLVSLHTELTPA